MTWLYGCSKTHLRIVDERKVENCYVYVVANEPVNQWSDDQGNPILNSDGVHMHTVDTVVT